MKRFSIFIVFLLLISSSIMAEGFYFDIGLGLGSATTEIDGVDVADSFDSSVNEMGVELSLKLGYGPIFGIPLYIVGELSGMGHRFYDDYNYLQFNSYLIGPGIIFYPTPLIQIGASLGFSTVANETDLDVDMYESDSGIAGNISIALDLGKMNNGCLLGIKYTMTKNILEISDAEQKSELLSFFIKYAYRYKQ